MINRWADFVNQESKKDYFKSLFDFLKEDSIKNIVYPKGADVFNAFKFTPLDQVKVVILGQDCYHGPGQAHGLSFSVPSEQPIPPSLRNIFKEIVTDVGFDNVPEHGCLKSWAKQGVLLLNSILTVRDGSPGSHKNKGWETFTDNAIKLLDTQDRPLVYLLWGAFARSKKGLVTNPLHLVLEAAHPSPLSAFNGFFGCKHFSKTNKFLEEHGLDPINWNIKGN